MDYQGEKSIELPAGLRAAFDQQNSKKRNRVSLTNVQQQTLSHALDINAFPDKEKRAQLAQQLGIEARTVQIWFQNQRQKVRKTARLKRLDRHHQMQPKMMSPPMLMGWSGNSPTMIVAPAASPRLSYSGSDQSEELNALVDAAVEELARNFEQVSSAISGMQKESDSAPTIHSPAPRQPDETPHERLLKAIPLSLLRSPKFRPRPHKSANNSPRLKTLQPRSQPNNESSSEPAI